MDRRKRVIDEHHDIALAVDAVGDIGRSVGGHRIAVAGHIGHEQWICAGVHAEHRNPGALGGFEARANLPRIDVDDDRVDLLVGDVLNPTDDRRGVALGVDDVDVPTIGLGRLLKSLNVELGAGLGEVWRDHGDLRRGESHASADRERQRRRESSARVCNKKSLRQVSPPAHSGLVPLTRP